MILQGPAATFPIEKH